MYYMNTILFLRTLVKMNVLSARSNRICKKHLAD
jgi:hypothetical protein